MGEQVEGRGSGCWEGVRVRGGLPNRWLGGGAGVGGEMREMTRDGGGEARGVGGEGWGRSTGGGQVGSGVAVV